MVLMRMMVLVVLILAVAGRAEVKYHPLTGRPMMLTVEGVSREHGKPMISAKRAEQIAREFLEVNGSVFGVKDIASELVMVPVEQDRYGFSHVNFFQVNEGVEVIGGALYVHLNRKGQVYAVNGKFAPDLMLSTTPAIEKEHAVKLAIAQAQVDMQTTDSPIAGEPRLVLLPLGFIHNEEDDDVHLAWQVQTDEDVSSQSMTYYIDALTGATLIGLDNVREINRRVRDYSSGNSQMDIYDAGYNYTFGRSEGQPVRGPNPRPGVTFGSNDVDSAYSQVGGAHDYYFSTFGINGANNLGGTGVPPFSNRTYVNVLIDPWIPNTAWPQDYCPNANYQSGVGWMYYCTGTVVADIVGHEYTHAVHYYAVRDANNNPIGVPYSGESGALDESGADISGDAIELWHTGIHDWQNGTNSIHGVTRNYADPPALAWGTWGRRPDRKYSEYYCCTGYDNGGVHENSTIVSKGCYLMAVGGEFNGCEFDSIGFEAVQQILYRAWAEYFTYTVTFADAVAAFQQSCIDLYDATHPEYLATVTAALQAVEMDQPGLCSGIAEVAPACAVHGAGVVSHDTTVYLGQNVIVNGTGGIAEREVTFYLSTHPAVDTIWAPINIYREVMNRDTVEPDGSLSANAWLADTLGVFDIIVDENSDGFYQPWADTILTVHVLDCAVSELTAYYVDPARIELRWLGCPGVSEYIVETDVTPEFANADTLAVVADTMYVDSVSVPAAELLLYRVRAVR